MKISILIANYNNGHFFKDCYDSIMAQTYTNWEAVILDDCSTDDSVWVIQSIIGDDSRFRMFFNEKNSGVGITKAKLIDLAEGDICGFVDPDDAVLPSAIQTAMAAYEKDKKVVMTYSDFIPCDENLTPLKKTRKSKQILNNDLYFFNFPIAINHFVTFDKKVYETTAKMDQSKKIAEDQDLYLKMYEKGMVKHIPEANYLYRAHPGGISQNDNKKKSYEYWAEVIYSAMKRRNIKKINGVAIPESYPGSEIVFKLLEYQNGIPYRIKKKIRILLQNIF